MGNAQNKVQFYSNDCPWILLLRRESNTFCVDNIMLAKIWFSINNGNWTKWSAICAEIICVISNSTKHAAWVRFEITSMISDQNYMTRGSMTTLLHLFWNHPNTGLGKFKYFIAAVLSRSEIKFIHFFFGGGGGVRVLETKVAKFAMWYSLSFIFLQFDWLL